MEPVMFKVCNSCKRLVNLSTLKCSCGCKEFAGILLNYIEEEEEMGEPACYERSEDY